MNTSARTTLSAVVALGLTAFATSLPAVAFNTGSTLKGTVSSFDGKYDLHVLDASGNVHDVRLHQGTIINPTGLTLENGMTVTILGTPGGGSLAANEIDTPYHVEPSYGAGYGNYGPYAGNDAPYGGYAPYGSYGYAPYGSYGYGPGYGYGYGYPSTGQVIINQPAVNSPQQFAPTGRRIPLSQPQSAPVRTVAPPAAPRMTAPVARTR